MITSRVVVPELGALIAISPRLAEVVSKTAV
jgi:hypothetical protein